MGRYRYFESVSVFGIFVGIFKSLYRYRYRYFRLLSYTVTLTDLPGRVLFSYEQVGLPHFLGGLWWRQGQIAI